jgi:carotenoid cleavage dioxygenase-like enzyme
VCIVQQLFNKDFITQVQVVNQTSEKDLVKMEIHQLGEEQFCSGASFVPRVSGPHEDDGWIISFVHDERTNTSQVHIIDTQRFEDAPVAKITLPQKVPYGFHGTFIHSNTNGHMNTKSATK